MTNSPPRREIRNVDELGTFVEVGSVFDESSVRGPSAATWTADALIAWDQGRVERASTLLELAARDADRGMSGLGRVFPRLVHASMLTGIGRLRDADRIIDQCSPLLDQERDELWIATPPIFRARLRLCAGHLGEAVAIARAAVERDKRIKASRFLSLAWLTLAAAALQGDDLVAAASADAAFCAAPPPPRAAVGWATYAWTHARIVDARDGPPSAFDALRPVYDDLDAHQGLLLEEPAAAAWLVRLALHEGERIPAIDVAARAELLAAANREVPSLAASAAHARGLLAGDPALLQHAVQGQPQPWAKASLAEDTGMLLREHGVDGPAREFLDRALGGYERAGSVRDAGRVRARLRDLGVRRGRGRARSRPVEGWDSLTNTERRVADLVAEGLTNRQTGARMFVSRHTIDFHLRQIFRKLAVSSRVELARIASDRSVDPRDRGM